MKNILKLLFLVIFSLFFVTGCSNEKQSKKPFIVFSDQPIHERTVPKSVFGKGKRVYFAAIKPKGFESEVIRVQIFKKDDKTAYLGYSYYSNKDYRLENDKFFLDYFIIHTEGHYVTQVFEITNLQKPVMIGDFWIVDR
ncbi:MAG: hypothetical protein E7Z91_00885 [Cyanobacteria bacterium SIG30]|nr:hypothetical protein [Cyanobacteria bacterium SIG30]